MKTNLITKLATPILLAGSLITASPSFANVEENYTPTNLDYSCENSCSDECLFNPTLEKTNFTYEDCVAKENEIIRDGIVSYNEAREWYEMVLKIEYTDLEKRKNPYEKKLGLLNQINKETLRKIAVTSMIGKHGSAKEKLASILLEAIQEVIEDNKIDFDSIKLEKKVGGGIEDSELIRGLVLDKERVNSSMPTKVTNCKIALIDGALEIKSPETDTKIQITDPTQLQGFIDQEEKILKGMVDKIIAAGANVVFCQKGIDDIAQYYLAKNKIYACRRIKKSDIEKLSKATGAKIVTKPSDLSPSDLGLAGEIEEIKVNDEMLTYVKHCQNPKAVTVLIRGGTEHVVDEIERAMVDSLSCLIASIHVGKVVAGAGATEIELSRGLRIFANTLSGREQLAVFAFADSIEVVPRTLAENAGLDPIDILTEIKAKHDSGMKWAGIDVISGKIMDSWAEGVIEPLKIKTQAVKSASEVAELILRIDDVIAGSGSRSHEMPNPESMM